MPSDSFGLEPVKSNKPRIMFSASGDCILNFCEADATKVILKVIVVWKK